MHGMQLEDVPVDICPACLGMWFDAGELSRAAGLSFSTDPTGKALRGAVRTESRCPLCTKPLFRRELDAGSGIFIEQCLTCSGLFLDRDEYSQAREHYRKAGAVPIARPRPAEPGERYEMPPSVDHESAPVALLQYILGIPLEINVPQTLFPPVVTTLLAMNCAVFITAVFLGFRETLESLALVPADVLAGRNLHSVLTSMFMHGGIFHLLGNMYFLYITGDNVEERFGSRGFILFYLACGLAATVAHIVGDPSSQIPAVGASGAISGVLGAYVIWFPENRFLIRMIVWWRPVRFEVPAWAYFGFWILLQVLYGSLEVPGVAWWAHVGGFGAGVLGALLFLRQPRADDSAS